MELKDIAEIKAHKGQGKPKRLYISGPITGITGYLERFRSWADAVRRYGFEPINPAEVCAPLAETLDYGELMHMCETLLSMSDGVFLMPGWETSRGARFEAEWASIHGLPIYTKAA